MSGKIILRAPSGGSVALVVDDTAIDTEVVVHGDSIGGGLGVNQTWRNLLSTRSLGVDYVNNTGKPIQVTALGTNTSTTGITGIQLVVDGVVADQNNVNPSASLEYTVVSASAIVPNGSTYRATPVGTVSLFRWSELRGD